MSNGLRLNGKPLMLRGRCVEPPSTDAEMRAWHDAGINAVSHAGEQTPYGTGPVEAADRAGLFVIERTQAPSHFLRLPKRYEWSCERIRVGVLATGVAGARVGV